MTDSIRAKRNSLRSRYRATYSGVAEALNSADPIGLIAMGAPSDEYEPEVGTILPRLHDASGVEDAQRIIREEFVNWFGVETAGPIERYATAAAGVWQVWTERLGEDA